VGDHGRRGSNGGAKAIWKFCASSSVEHSKVQSNVRVYVYKLHTIALLLVETGS